MFKAIGQRVRASVAWAIPASLLLVFILGPGADKPRSAQRLLAAGGLIIAAGAIQRSAAKRLPLEVATVLAVVACFDAASASLFRWTSPAWGSVDIAPARAVLGVATLVCLLFFGGRRPRLEPGVFLNILLVGALVCLFATLNMAVLRAQGVDFARQIFSLTCQVFELALLVFVARRIAPFVGGSLATGAYLGALCAVAACLGLAFWSA